MPEPKEMKLLLTGKQLQKGNTFEIAYRGRGGKPFIRHTDEYKATKEDMAWQTKALRNGAQFTGPVCLVLVIYYSSKASDLDESLVMDALEQGGAYKNDNQVFQKWSEKHLDNEDPRIEVTITPVVEGVGVSLREAMLMMYSLTKKEPLLVEVVGGEFRAVEE